MHVLALIPTGHARFSASSEAVVNGFGDSACCYRFEENVLLRVMMGGDILTVHAAVMHTALSAQYPLFGQSDDGSSGTFELSSANGTGTRSSCRSKGLEATALSPSSATGTHKAACGRRQQSSSSVIMLYCGHCVSTEGQAKLGLF